VPLAKRLHDKGLPASAALAFLLAAPIVNPITIISTAVAFREAPYPIALFRVSAGLLSALLIACIVELLTAGKAEFRSTSESSMIFVPVGRPVRRVPFAPRMPVKSGFASRLIQVGLHVSSEFLDTSRYLIAGIGLAAAARSLLPAAVFSRSLASPFAALGLGSVSAYVLSLCSSSDAFVARSLFVPQSYLSVLSFLVLGPMMDIKNTLLLARFISPLRLATLILLIFLITFGLSAAFSFLWMAST
jgi:uncharacterized protein